MYISIGNYILVSPVKVIIMNDRTVKNCKHSVIASMSVCRCANCNRTFATIRKQYIDRIKELETALQSSKNIEGKQ